MANLQKGVLDKISHFLSKQDFSHEVIVVDDGSTDGSVEFVEEFIKDEPHFSLLKNSHMGKGGAVSSGMLKGKGQWKLFIDMDQAAPIEEINKLLPFTKSYDIVIGSRSNQRKDAPWTRIIMANGMIILRKILIGLFDISDTQCGFKLFRKDAAEKIFMKLAEIHNFKKISGSAVTAGFDIEILLLAKKFKYKIKEVPVKWLYVESRRVSPIIDSIEGVLDLLQIRLNMFSGKYRNL